MYVGKRVQDVGELLERYVLWIMLAIKYGPVLEVRQQFGSSSASHSTTYNVVCDILVPVALKRCFVYS